MTEEKPPTKDGQTSDDQAKPSDSKPLLEELQDLENRNALSRRRNSELVKQLEKLEAERVGQKSK